jgi:hypothetical protein
MTKASSTRPPTAHIAPFGLRMQPELREKLEKVANEAGRSLNAEIVARLQASFEAPQAPKDDGIQPIGGALTWYITAEIRELAKQQGVPFDEMFAKLIVAGLHPDAPEVLYLPILPGATTKELRNALLASVGVAHPNAAIVSEMIGRAPWAPDWLTDRMKSAVQTAVNTDPATEQNSETRKRGRRPVKKKD